MFTAQSQEHSTADSGYAKKHFDLLPDKVIRRIFEFLQATELARAREVCIRWDLLAADDLLWKKRCVANWAALETDQELWQLIDESISLGDTNCWRNIYPKIEKTPRWTCRLQKTRNFICNVVAHQISGAPVGDVGLPNVLVVERRFSTAHLQTFVMHDAAVLYFEPESEADRHGFDEFIEYLNTRTRAGLALEGPRRFVFIPPCDYTRVYINYHGRSLLGIEQSCLSAEKQETPVATA